MSQGRNGTERNEFSTDHSLAITYAYQLISLSYMPSDDEQGHPQWLEGSVDVTMMPPIAT